MMLRRRTVLNTMTGLPAITLLLQGCGTSYPMQQRSVQVPPGTMLAYHRHLSGSFGSGDAQPVWTYTEDEWQGQKVLRATNSLGGGTLHDPDSFAVVAQLDMTGQPSMSYHPPIGIEWPIMQGKAWRMRHIVRLHPSGREFPYENLWNIEAQETVKVPAGRFETYRVVRNGSDEEQETRWIGRQRGLPLVKRTLLRAPTHSQGTGLQEAELVWYKIPPQDDEVARRAAAPG